MTIHNLATARGPSAADLRVLERLGRHRAALEALTPAGEHRAAVLRRLFATLDDMEEALCEEGRGAPLLAEGWQRLDELEARLAEAPARSPAPPPTPIRRHRRPPAAPTHRTQGEPNLINAIDTLRSVARRAVEDPAPENPSLRLGSPAKRHRTRRPARSASPPGTPPEAQLLQLHTRLLESGDPGDRSSVLIAAQTLAVILRLVAADQPKYPILEYSRDTGSAAGPDIPPEMTVKEEARIDLLRQERRARARSRGATAPDALWHDLLDFTSEALETFIRRRHLAGARSCLDLLDLLAEAFAVDRPEAA